MKMILRKIQMLLGRGIVTLTEDSEGFQKVQAKLFAKESRDGIERIEDYGFTSHPPNNSEGLFGFINGDRSRAFAIKVGNRKYRLKDLGQGEVAIYTDEGDKIHFKRGRIIDIETETLNITATNKVHINSPILEVTDKIKAGDNIDSDKSISATLDVTAGVKVSAPLVQAGNALMSQDTVSDGTETMSQHRTEFETHTHPENGSGGGTTGPPT